METSKTSRVSAFRAQALRALLIGVFSALAFYGLARNGTSSVPNPAYAQHKALVTQRERLQMEHDQRVDVARAEYERLVDRLAGAGSDSDTLKRKNTELSLQREFEEALAGERSAGNIADPSLRNIAGSLVSMKTADPTSRASAVVAMATEIARLRDQKSSWVPCVFVARTSCTLSYAGPLTVLGEPDRLAKLITGDATAVIPRVQLVGEIKIPQFVPPSPPPELNIPLPSAPAEFLQPPVWPLYGAPIVFWIIFAASFSWIGYRWWQGRSKDDPRVHPLRAYPRSIVDGIIALAALPSFFLMHLAHWLTLDLPDAIRARRKGTGFLQNEDLTPVEVAIELLKRMMGQAREKGDIRKVEIYGQALSRIELLSPNESSEEDGSVAKGTGLTEDLASLEEAERAAGSASTLEARTE